MFRRREPDLTEKMIPLALGATAGLAAGLLLLQRTGRGILRRRTAHRDLEHLEQMVVDELTRDPVLGLRPIEVEALAVGIVELSGSVESDDEARRAIEIAQGVAGIRTVLNRLDVEALEEHLADTRRRYENGDPALHETHWYGMGVGTGRRRQGRSTDPVQRDDRVDIIDRSLGTDRALETPSESDDVLPNAVKGHSSGLAATGRRTGPVRTDRSVGGASTAGDDEYSGAHINVKPGEELTLEQVNVDAPLDRERD